MPATTVWKISLTGAETQVSIPAGARALSLQPQGTAPVIYVLVDPEAPKVIRRAILLGTGEVRADLEKFTFVGSLGGSGFHCFLERELVATGVDTDGNVAYAPAEEVK